MIPSGDSGSERRASLLGVLAADVMLAAAGSGLAAVLLRYLHDTWMPGWAMLCGALAGLGVHWLRGSYASFPAYLRRFLTAGTLLLATVITVWATLFREPTSYWLLRWREASTLGLLMIVLGLALTAVIYSHARMRSEIEQAREREAALREAALHAQLRALQAQINPHFLFNAFNALAELTHDDPAVAEQLVSDLAFLLRYSLRSSAQETVPLAQELEAVDRYLRVERIRLGDRLRVEREVDEEALAVAVPGLLLQPLVENAVQHAVAPRPEGGSIRMVVERDGATVRIAVEDDGPGLPESLYATLDRLAHLPSPGPPDPAIGTAGAGGGLANVLQRLALRYRGQARVTTRRLEPGFRIELRIPV